MHATYPTFNLIP